MADLPAGFYVTPQEAVHLLQERQLLRMQVEEWFRDVWVPMPPLDWTVPIGLVSRQIATATYKDLLFAHLCQRVGLLPVWQEFTADTFVTACQYKRNFIIHHLCSGRGRSNGFRMQKVQLLNPFVADGKPLSRFPKVIDYHHEKQDQLLPKEKIRCDWSDWLTALGTAGDYYRHYLALFVAHGVLFENFHDVEAEQSFRRRIVDPAWEFLLETFGARPLIVHLPETPEFMMIPANEHWREHGVIPEAWLK